MREVTVRALSSPVRTVRGQTADAAAPTGGVPAGAPTGGGPVGAPTDSLPAGHAGGHRRAASHL